MCLSVRLKYISALIYQYPVLMLKLKIFSSVTNDHLRKNTVMHCFLCFAKTATGDGKNKDDQQED